MKMNEKLENKITIHYEAKERIPLVVGGFNAMLLGPEGVREIARENTQPKYIEKSFKEVMRLGAEAYHKNKGNVDVIEFISVISYNCTPFVNSAIDKTVSFA